MADTQLKIRVKEGAELPGNPDNRRPGQFQFDSDWYPQGGTPQNPKKLTRTWSVVPEGAALAAQSFFTQGGECLVEVEPYEGPTQPYEVAAAALEFGGRSFNSVDDLVRYVQSGDVEERTRQIQARREELEKLDKSSLLNEARIANLSVGGASNEETLRRKLIEAQFGEGASLTPAGPVSTAVNGAPKLPEA